jgi:FtsH-binding integral membrane protein
MERIFADGDNPAYAGSSGFSLDSVFEPAKNFKDLGSLTNVLVQNAFTIAGVIFLALLIFGGFQFIVAAGGGDAKKLEQGKQALTTAVIGLVIVIGSVWIVQIIEMLTGLKLITK